MDRRSHIDALVADLRPVGRRLPASAAIALWLAASWCFVAAVTVATGPLRPGAGSQLVASPRFALECLAGLMAGAVAIQGALVLSIPGSGRLRARARAAAGLLAVWAGAYAVGLIAPALEPSMAGKRDGCIWETVAFGLIPLAFGLALARRRFPLDRAWVGGLIGAAAGALPALMMQLACMYDPAHILMFHLSAIPMLAAAGALAGALLFRRP